MPPAPPALDLDRDEGEGPALDERSWTSALAPSVGDAEAPSGSPSVNGGASRSPRAGSGGSPRVGGSPRWKQHGHAAHSGRRQAPPEPRGGEAPIHTDTPREHSHEEPVEEEPLSNFLFGMLGDTGKYCSEHMYDRESELRREGVHNFLAVPWNIEPMLIFGYVTCLDCFMHQFTLLPIRTAFSVGALARAALGGAPAHLTPFQYCELLRGVLIVAVSALVLTVDMSQAYHTVRNQAIYICVYGVVYMYGVLYMYTCTCIPHRTQPGDDQA